jgi:hypothetical protein
MVSLARVHPSLRREPSIREQATPSQTLKGEVSLRRGQGRGRRSWQDSGQVRGLSTRRIHGHSGGMTRNSRTTWAELDRTYGPVGLRQSSTETSLRAIHCGRDFECSGEESLNLSYNSANRRSKDLLLRSTCIDICVTFRSTCIDICVTCDTGSSCTAQNLKSLRRTTPTKQDPCTVKDTGNRYWNDSS